MSPSAGTRSPSFVADRLRAHARDRPDAVAVVCGDATATFGELHERSSRIAHALPRDGRVAYLGETSVAAVELFFACAKAGAVFVPLNWRLARPEIEAVLADAGPAVLVCGPGHDLPGAVALETLTGDDAADPHADADVVLQLYTSGTTGEPKGVLLTQTNLEARTWICARWELDPTSVALCVTPLFHVGGIGWFVVAFAAGARTVLVPRFDAPAVLDLMERERVTNAFLVPTMIQLLLAAGAEERRFAMRTIAYGASPITTPVLRRALTAFGCPLFQCYGLTESTGTIVQLDADDHRDELLRSAGRPFEWVELRIVDPETGADCPTGVVGEVTVRGPFVMAGYHGRPEATAAVLDAHGWLSTGDGGYLDAGGYLFLTDRIKDMIVTGAENVYPIEVEDVLAAHPGVEEVAVVGVPDERWGETVVAVVVGDVDPDALVAFARERLAGYKLPRRVHVVDALPKTASGKILKRALRDDIGPRA